MGALLRSVKDGKLWKSRSTNGAGMGRCRSKVLQKCSMKLQFTIHCLGKARACSNASETFLVKLRQALWLLLELEPPILSRLLVQQRFEVIRRLTLTVAIQSRRTQGERVHGLLSCGVLCPCTIYVTLFKRTHASSRDFEQINFAPECSQGKQLLRTWQLVMLQHLTEIGWFLRKGNSMPIVNLDVKIALSSEARRPPSLQAAIMRLINSAPPCLSLCDEVCLSVIKLVVIESFPGRKRGYE